MKVIHCSSTAARSHHAVFFPEPLLFLRKVESPRDGTMSNLVYLEVLLLMVGGVELHDLFKVPSNSNHSMILFCNSMI